MSDHVHIKYTIPEYMIKSHIIDHKEEYIILLKSYLQKLSDPNEKLSLQELVDLSTIYSALKSIDEFDLNSLNSVYLDGGSNNAHKT